MKIEKLALYGEDGRVGILEKTAARGVAWVSAYIENSIVTADVEYDGETVENVAALLINKKVKIKTDAKNDRATVCLSATLKLNGDKFNYLDGHSDKKAVAAIKAGFKKAIEDELKEAYESSTELGCDPMYIGRQFYRFDPKYYNDGYELGKTEVVFDIDVIVK